MHIIYNLIFEEKIKNLQQTLQRTKDELGHFKSTSNAAIQEKESTIAVKAVAENNLKQQLESSKKKYEGEIANLRHALKGMQKNLLEFGDILANS